MLDRFDHRSEEELGDKGLFSKEQRVEHGDGDGDEGFKIGEEEEEFQDSSCSEESATSNTYSTVRVLQSDGSPFSSPSVRESTAGAFAGRNGMPIIEWHCDFPGCSLVFQRRCDRNRHEKYHFKKWECLEPSCKAKNKAFSLEKDLKRHKSSHDGVRYFCPNHGCALAAGGTSKGFSRKDNWRRHLKRCIPDSSGLELDLE